MPGTPMGPDPRGPHSMDLAAAMNHARTGLENPNGDYFLGAPQYSTGVMRPRSPMVPLPGHDPYHGNSMAMNGNHNHSLGFRERDREREVEDFVRKENRVAALLNGAILAPAKYAQVHPLRCEDGSFPADFKLGKTVEAMKVLDNGNMFTRVQIASLTA
ncbi:MAG: hypothetical protein Q9200_001348 [Gallowayella weberi]